MLHPTEQPDPSQQISGKPTRKEDKNKNSTEINSPNSLRFPTLADIILCEFWLIILKIGKPERPRTYTPKTSQIDGGKLTSKES